MIRTGTDTFTLLWTILRSAILLVFNLILFPLKALNVVLSVIWLPFYIISQTLSIVINIIYLILLVYILQGIFGFQIPVSLTDFVSEIINWIFPGFIVMTPSAVNTDIFAGLSMQQVADMLKRSKM